MFQSFAHAYDIIHRVTEPTVKLNHRLVGSADLEIDLGTACLPKQSFRLGYNRSRQPSTLVSGRNRQVIEPATVSFITSHNGGHDLPIDFSYQESLRVNLELATDVAAGIVPGANQITLLPEGEDGWFVLRPEASDFHWGLGCFMVVSLFLLVRRHAHQTGQAQAVKERDCAKNPE
jgi:hypothetical protein